VLFLSVDTAPKLEDKGPPNPPYNLPPRPMDILPPKPTRTESSSGFLLG